ncbi:hypothetical protein [Micromonospora zamorensis]|uniref:hypothetical protein n=1 Tax=Micromonospora zamorensis TaxID=709883 RepID=UPI002E19E448
MTDVGTLAALAREIDTTCRLTGTFVLRSGRTADEPQALVGHGVTLRALFTRADLEAHRTR